MANSTLGRALLPLRIPSEVLSGAEAPPHDPHGFTSAPSFHLAPRSGWGSDPHGPIYYKGRYHLFFQACHSSCQWFWGLHWEHIVSEDGVHWVRLPPAITPTPGWLDADGCFTGNLKIDPTTGSPTLFYTGARLRHNPAVASAHPDPPLSACNPLMLHWETQLCAVADPDDDLLVRWTKVQAPWMELPHCAYLTAWRDPFFVPPKLDIKTGEPLPGQPKRQQVPPPELPYYQPADGEAALHQHTEPGAQILQDGDEYLMLIGSGLEGVGGTALCYRSPDLTKGWRFDGYLATWPDQQTGLCWECPHLLHLPDLPEGLHCLTSKIAPAYLLSTDVAAVEERRDRQAQLVARAKQAMDEQARAVAKKGVAAQVLAAAEQAQLDHEAAATRAHEESTRATAAVNEAVAQRECAAAERQAQEGRQSEAQERDTWDAAAAAATAAGESEAESRRRVKAEQEKAAKALEHAAAEMEAAKKHAALASAAADVERQMKEAGEQQRMDKSVSLAVSEGAQRAAAAGGVRGGEVAAVAEAQQQGVAQPVALSQQQPPAGEEGEKAAMQAAEHVEQAVVEGKAAQPAGPQEEAEFSPLALAASGMVHALPGDLPQLGPAQTFMISSMFGDEDAQQQGLSVRASGGSLDAASLAARLMEEQQEQLHKMSAGPEATGAAPISPPSTPRESAAAEEEVIPNPLFRSMQREISAQQQQRLQTGKDPFTVPVPLVIKRRGHAGVHKPPTTRPISLFASPPSSPSQSPPASPFHTPALSFSPIPSPRASLPPSEASLTATTPPPHVPSAPVAAAVPEQFETAAARETGPAAHTGSLGTQPPALHELALPAAGQQQQLQQSQEVSTHLPPIPEEQQDTCAVPQDRPGAPEPPPTPPLQASTSTSSPHCAQHAQHAALEGTTSLPPLPTTLQSEPSLSSAAFAALAPLHDQYSRKLTSIAAATSMAEGALAAQQPESIKLARKSREWAAGSGQREEQGGLLHQAVSVPSDEVLEQARSIIRDAAGDAGNVKAAVEASMASMGIPGVLSTSAVDSSVKSMIAEGVQQQLQQRAESREQQQQDENERQQQLKRQALVDESLEQRLTEQGSEMCEGIAEQAAQQEPEIKHAISASHEQAHKGLAELQGVPQEQQAAQLHPNPCVQASAPRGDARQGAESMPAAQKGILPQPPLFSRDSKPSATEIRAACRAYAEAAAASQGFDLNIPSCDSRVVRQVAQGPPPVAEAAAPGQRWFLGLAPDAATYGIIYFLGDFANGRFNLEESTGPNKLDMGNVLYAPVAFYDQKARRMVVWGYLKELWQLPPPPAMCNKFSCSGCVSLPRALYLSSGKLYQVPLPEQADLRKEGCCFRVAPHTPLLPDSPIVVPASEACEGSVSGGDHMDIELVIRRGNATRTSLLLDSWRPNGRGAAALVFDWQTKHLKIVYKAHMHTHEWSEVPATDLRTAAEAAQAAKQEGTRWTEDPECRFTTYSNPSVLGGRHTITDEDGAVFDLLTDIKVPPVPDMNPEVVDWIRMDRGRAGGVLDMRDGEPLELRIFIDGSAVEVFTGTGQVLSTRVYRGAPPCHRASSESSDHRSAKLQLLSMDGTCEIEHAEFHEMRSIWLRGEDDAPLPPPTRPEALKTWEADARRAAGFAEEAAQAIGESCNERTA